MIIEDKIVESNCYQRFLTTTEGNKYHKECVRVVIRKYFCFLNCPNYTSVVSFKVFFFFFCRHIFCTLKSPGSLTSLVLIVCPILFLRIYHFLQFLAPLPSVTGARSSQGSLLCFPPWLCRSALGFADSFIVAPSSLLFQTTDIAFGLQWLQVAVPPFFEERGAH